MSNKQITAVKWLIEQLKSKYDIDIERLSVTDKANAMFQNQIEEAWTHGAENWDAEMEGDDYFTSTFTEE